MALDLHEISLPVATDYIGQAMSFYMGRNDRVKVIHLGGASHGSVAVVCSTEARYYQARALPLPQPGDDATIDREQFVDSVSGFGRGDNSSDRDKALRSTVIAAA